MAADNLKQYSTLTKPEDLAAVGSDALDEIQAYTEDLTAYMTVAQWIVNAQADLTRPMLEVTSETVSQYQALTTQLGELTEKQTAQMDNGVKTRLEQRLALSIQKQSAIGELQSVYYSIDQKDYSESSQAALKQALQNGMMALENSETKEQVTQNLQQAAKHCAAFLRMRKHKNRKSRWNYPLPTFPPTRGIMTPSLSHIKMHCLQV